MQEIIIFVVAFVVPFIFYRIGFVLAKKTLEKPFIPREGIQVHHMHYGVTLVLFGSIFLLFIGKTALVVVFLGAGLGLIFDEFIGSLMLPEHRTLGLQIYRKALKRTFVLIFAIATLVLIFGLIYF